MLFCAKIWRVVIEFTGHRTAAREPYISIDPTSYKTLSNKSSSNESQQIMEKIYTKDG
jgi:hypothetical protein